jgi:DNA-binding NtrC family response regulator
MKPRVLVVDDEESILFALKDYLELQGFAIEYAGTLEEARTLLAGRPPYDAVIADLRLSPRDKLGGLELLEQVREQYPDARTLLLTAYGSRDIERRAKQLGVDSVLPKPIPLAEVASTLHRIVGELSDGGT